MHTAAASSSTRATATCSAFGALHAAIFSAIGVQRDLAREEWCADYELRVRIGMHTGEVVVDDSGDLFGKHVVVAARIGALADGGEILVLVARARDRRTTRRRHVRVAARRRAAGDRGVETVWTVNWREE